MPLPAHCSSARIPMVISEVHHGCTREEQLRWFVEIWNAARDAQQEGIDLRAERFVLGAHLEQVGFARSRVADRDGAVEDSRDLPPAFRSH